MTKVIKLTAVQTTTAVKVLSNLKKETAVALQNEKSNQIQQMAKQFGVAAVDLQQLKGKLVPTLPYEFRVLGIKSTQIEEMMDSSRRNQIMAGAEVISESSEVLKRKGWTADRNCRYKTIGFRPASGKFAE